MGDLSELMASISEKGIIEPIIVRRRAHRYQIIAGERRYQAAVQLGMSEVPVVIRDVDDAEVIEIALVENLQRKDLTAFEEAEALHHLSEPVEPDARAAREASGEVADGDYRVSDAESDARRRQKPLSAGRHSL